MMISFKVIAVDYADDGTSFIWLEWPINEPGTAYFPSLPAVCEHQNVKVGDWWGISLNLITRDGERV